MDFFGLDIGSHTIKAVELRSRGDKYQLLAIGSIAAPPKGFASEAESDLTLIAQTIKKLHQEAKIKTRNVVSALPQDQVFTRIITFPQLDEDELASALKWEAEQYVPIPLEEVTLTHQVLGKVRDNHKEEKIEVLLAAAPKTLIDKVMRVLQAAGLNPVSLETETVAIARSLVPEDEEAVLLVDLGAKATDIAIVEKGQVVFVRSTPTAGEALTRAVRLGLGLESDQAEAYKKAYGASPEELEGKVVSALGPVLEVIVREMEKTIQFYSSRQKTIKRIVLTGGSAGLPEVASILAKKLNLEVQLGNPFASLIEDDLVVQIPVADIPLYSAAVGLAMKPVD